MFHAFTSHPKPCSTGSSPPSPKRLVGLLWSIVNPVHELRVGGLLAERPLDVPVTLSHPPYPILREYRRVVDLHQRVAEAR